ncbi:hypothetical protein MW887_009668 [Aspergillus wentii]|nr:hypothetical protein MW887_009668 [Aspergillus wentii]
MEDSPTMLYPAGFPLLLPLIPTAIRQRMSRLYSFRPNLPNIDHNDNESIPNSHRGLASSSDPQLAYYRPMSESSTGEVQRRPVTASAEDRGLSDSSSKSDTSISISDGESHSPTSKYEADSGVRWNRVIPAFNLLRNAGYEAQQSHSDVRLVRSLYITAVGYLLDALPTDLTDHETRTITQKLPDSIQTSFPTAVSQTNNSSHHPVSQRTPSERSYLHRLLASTIIQLFLLIQFLLPYAKILLQQMYQYERSHRVTERLVAATVDVADSLGKGGMNLGTAILGFQEGKVGAAVADLVSWWVEGIAGGIHEGVGEGMMILGVVRSDLNSGMDGMSTMHMGQR